MQHIERIAIFVFYNDQGRLSKDVEYLISCLRQCVEYLVVVVNGTINECKIVEKYADYIIIRENRGFDAGAYKCALMDERVCKMLDECQELVFCNDTFYGPFISFAEIFNAMEEKEVDFWGLNLSDNGILSFIQSYFLVFRRIIWESGDLRDFFKVCIDENTLDFREVLILFERGIFTFLKNKGYTYDALKYQKYHIFSAVDGNVCFDQLPLLKKKAFTDKFYDKKKILNALCYIDKHYDYDVNIILEDIRERYLINIEYNEVKNHIIEINAKAVEISNVSQGNLKDFASFHKRIFIYGVGAYGKSVAQILGKSFIEGFIVSDNQTVGNSFEDLPIYRISDFSQKTSVPIIVALNKNNRKQVQDVLKEFKNILYLF